MTYQELRALLVQNKHDHAVEAVSRIRYRILEARLARAIEGRLTAERKLHEHVCSENDELNRLKAENRRLQGEVAVLRKAILSA
jgi:hypothetical protein